MTKNELQAISDEIMGDLFISAGVSDSLYHVFSFLLRHIPADRIICSVVDRKRMVRNIIAEYDAMGNHISPSVEPINKTLSIPKILSLMTDSENGISIVNDTHKDSVLFESLSLNKDPFRSTLILFIYISEGDNSLITINFTSAKPNVYTAKHGEILAMLRKPLQKLMAGQLLQINDSPLYMTNASLQNEPDDLLRRCPCMKNILRRAEIAAKINLSILILGPTGSGKEVLADTIFKLSKRSKGAFIKINCGAIPESLIDSELFGYEKGAFTGAVSGKPGYFEQAQGGMVFLDEVGDLPPSAQVRLLRVLENQEIRRVGGRHPQHVNVRIIAATHRDLIQMVRKGSFREDLWHRLNIFPIVLPPLDERKDDIPVLTEYFYALFLKEQGLKNAPALTSEFIMQMRMRHWPGNVRELRHTVERSVVESMIAGYPKLRIEEQQETESAKRGPGRPVLGNHSAKDIYAALEKTGWKIQGENGAAKLLDLGASTLRNRMKAMGIRKPSKHRQ